MLGKIHAGSRARIFSLILACSVLAACENEVSTELYERAGGDQDGSSTTSVSTSTDSGLPSISSITVAEGEHIIGAEVTITIIAADAESGLRLKPGSTFNTQQLANFAAVSGQAGYYTAIYTVISGDPDVALGSSVSANIALTNTDGDDSAATTSVALDDSTGIDANIPAISALSLAEGTYGVGDVAAITISAADAETGLALAEGSTFNGQELTSLDSSEASAGDYLVAYTVVEGDLDIADGSAASINIALSDAFGNLSAAEEALLLSGARIDANSPSISDLVIADDNLIDSNDDLANIVVSGSVSGVEDGQELTLRIGDDITAYVDLGENNSSDSNGSFSITFDLSTLSDGTYPVTADVADLADNAAQATVDAEVDAALPSIDSLTVADDNRVNGLEISSLVTALGVVSNVEAGQEVSLYIEETMQTDPITALAVVDANSTFSVDFNLSSLGDGDYKLVADAYDLAGNMERFIGSLIIDTTAPEFSSIVIASDNIVNAAEERAAEILGSTNGVEDGQSITLNVVGIDINGEAIVSGNSFSTSINFAALADSATISVTANVADSAGNAAPQAIVNNIVKDTLAPEIALSSVAGDDFIDGSEVGAVVVIGSTSGAENGQLVSLALTDGSTTLETTTSVSNDAFSATLDLSSLADSSAISASASVADVAGNPATTAVEGIIKDTLAPAISLTSIAADNIINASEAASVVIVGSTSNVENGQLVSLAVSDGATTVESATSVSDGAFSSTLDLSSLADSSAISATANVADLAGNSAAAASVVDIIKDTAAPAISLTSVAGDGVFGATEMASVAIIGSTVGVADGQIVALTATDGTTTASTTTSISSDAFSTTIDLSALADSISISVTADVADVAGNPAPQASIGSIVKDTVAPELVLSSVASDNVINAAEVASVAIIGSTAGVVDGQIVSLAATDGTTTATTTAAVTDNAFSATIDLSALAESTSISATADVADSAGNAAPQARLGYLIKDTLAPAISITSVASDGVISASEVDAVAIIGSTAGAEDGQIVALAVTAGTIRVETTTTVIDDSFSATLDLSDIADSTTISLTADVADAAGNPAAQARIDDLVKNTSAPVISNITVAEDDIVNAAEAGAVDISGTTSGVEAGQQVSLTIGGISATAIIDSSGAFNTAVDLSTIADSPAISLIADVSDAAGNSAEQFSRSVMKDTASPSILSLVVAGDNSVDNSNNLSAVTVSGSTSGVESGQSVALTLSETDGAVAALAVVDDSGAFSGSVNLSGFANGIYGITAEVTDLAGNPSDPLSVSFAIEIILPTQAVIASSISLSADTGRSATDFITSQARQSISAELNASLDPEDSLYASVDSGGSWLKIFSESNLSGATSFSWDTILVEGENAIQFVVADVYDKNGSLTEQVYFLDTTPSEQSISAIDISNDSGASDSDFLTNISAQTISASLDIALESGETLYGSVDSGASWSNIINKISDSNAIVWDGVELQLGTYNIVLRIADIADNNSSFERKYTLDQTAPVIITLGTDTSATEGSAATLDASASTDNNGIDSYSWAQVQSDGSALTGDALTISDADTATAQVIAAGIVDDSVAEQDFYFAATIIDSAGNSATGVPVTFTVSNIYQTPTLSSISTAANFDQISLSWDADSSLAYSLYRSTDPTCSISSYSTCSASALYSASNGISISGSSASLIDTNLEFFTTYYYWLEAQTSNAELVISSPDATAATTSGPALNDTGVVRGADYPDGFDALGGGATCNGAVDESVASIDDEGIITSDDLNLDGDTEDLILFDGEDCELGRDVTANDPSDGHAGFSYTRLNSDGSEYSGSGDYATEPWACVLDNVTGVIWEVKTTDGGTHDNSIEYTWYNADGVDIDGTIFRGTDNGIDPTTQELVDATNAEQLCGLSNWRLPTSSELVSIRNNTIVIDGDNFSVESDYFPNLKSVSFWSSSVNYYANADGDGNPATYPIWNHGPEDSVSWTGNGATDEPNHAILVSSSPTIEDGYFNDWSDDRYEIHNDGTVTDKRTGLMWMRCGYDDFFAFYDSVNDTCVAENPGGYGAGPHHYALAREVRLANKEITYGFDGGNNHNIGGYTDWRLPSLTELFSLRDHTAGSIGIEFITQEIVDASNGVYTDEDIGELYGDDDTALMNPVAFPNAEPLGYWASTPRAIGGEAYFVGFAPTGIFSIGVSDMRVGYRIRLVRDAD